LVAAAHIVVHDLASKDNYGTGGAFLLDSTRLEEWGFCPQEFKNAIKKAETFFKHAKNDPHDIETLSEIETQAIFYSAIECYRRLVKEKSPSMGLFMAWLAFQHPVILNEFAREKFADLIPALQKLSRREFFTQLRNSALDF
jgi:hypothetical protein